MCEDELICDLAETYGIYNYKELSPMLVATLTIGLRDESRVKMKISGQRITMDQMLMALIVDDLNLLLWSRKRKRGKRPPSLYKKLTEPKKEKDELRAFESPEDYERWRKATIDG